MSTYGYNLQWLEDSMHVSFATVIWKRREAVWSIGVSMKFIQVASGLVQKDCKLLLITQYSRITEQDTIPVPCCITLWLTTLIREQNLCFINCRSLAQFQMLIQNSAKISIISILSKYSNILNTKGDLIVQDCLSRHPHSCNDNRRLWGFPLLQIISFSSSYDLAHTQDRHLQGTGPDAGPGPVSTISNISAINVFSMYNS